MGQQEENHEASGPAVEEELDPFEQLAAALQAWTPDVSGDKKTLSLRKRDINLQTQGPLGLLIDWLKCRKGYEFANGFEGEFRQLYTEVHEFYEKVAEGAFTEDELFNEQIPFLKDSAERLALYVVRVKAMCENDAGIAPDRSAPRSLGGHLTHFGRELSMGDTGNGPSFTSLSIPEGPADVNTQSMKWDVFISHASEDKEAFVRPLAIALQGKNVRVWFDEFALTVGDSLHRSIDHGLASSRYGIVVISPNFLAKEWPQKELDGLVAREVDGRKVILPVWHNVDAKTVRQHSPLLADRVATSTDKGVQAVVADLMKAMR